MNQKLLTYYGLKFNPFNQGIPTDDLFIPPQLENFCWRVEETLIQEGGFALIYGDPGLGKSVALRVLENRLNNRRDTKVGSITHATSNLSDFYRELGDIFGVTLSVNNRWCGFKMLRERWLSHLQQHLFRPVLLVDEAQEINNIVLNELRLLSSMQFDSRILLTVILAGDGRLTNKLKEDALLPLGSRIRVRLKTEYVTHAQLAQCLKHIISQAGNQSLMTQELVQALSEHSMGNYRVMCTMANDLLTKAFKNEQSQLDEKLFFDCFSLPSSTVNKPNNRK